MMLKNILEYQIFEYSEDTKLFYMINTIKENIYTINYSQKVEIVDILPKIFPTEYTVKSILSLKLSN